MATPNPPAELSPPPKFQSQTNPIIGPQTPEEWAQFWRWLYSQYVTVTYLSGNNLPPTITPPAVTQIQGQTQIPGQVPQFPQQQPDPGDLIALVSGFHQATATRRETPQIPQGFPAVPYPTRGQAWLLDTYANWTSANYAPSVYQPGQPFLVTDRNVVYAVQLVAGTATWVYETGIYIAATASRPTTGFNGGALGTADTGLLFLDSTLTELEYWSGAAWVKVPNVPASATVLASNANNQIIAAPLTSAHIFVGNGSNLPADVALSGDATLSNTGALTLATVNASPGSYTNADITVDAKGLVTAAVSGSSGAGTTGSWTPGVQFGGAATGITYTLQTGTYFKISNMVFAYFDTTLSSKGSATGIAEVTGLPFSSSATFIAGGSLSYLQNMSGLTATPSVLASVGTTNARLLDFSATDGTNISDTNFTNTTRIVGLAIYYS